jgi:hypothetical protein
MSPTYFGLSRAILEGTTPASAVMGIRDAYDHFMTDGGSRFLGSSTKIEHGQDVGVLSTVLYMQPARESGREACASRTDGCSAACLAEGTGRMSQTAPQQARRRRHAAFYADRKRFLADLHVEIARHRKRARKLRKVCAVRLNGTTDLPWHRMAYVDHAGNAWDRIHDAFPDVHFYEYTKHPLSLVSKGAIPSNLHLTFSISEREESDDHARAYLLAGYNAAVVLSVKRHMVPDDFGVRGAIHGWTQRFPTVDGDAHDARFLDPPGHIVVLTAKGRAKEDTSGFVRTPN